MSNIDTISVNNKQDKRQNLNMFELSNADMESIAGGRIRIVCTGKDCDKLLPKR
ncbi:MAG: hypothetical protein RMY34_24950 [Aulosira sp. DedQUE10]|nr:hypothetical protein [Aulosira sp. DedQUE10]